MLLALGLLSIIQAVFLPGYLLVRALGLHRGGRKRMLLLSFGSSLVFNHLLVFVLTAAHAYTARVMYGVVGAEVVLVVVYALLARAPGDPLDRDLVRWRALIPALAARRPPAALAGYVSILALLVAFAWYCWQGGAASARVFSSWDAVVSWNRWALDWSHDRLPLRTWHYPQALPTTISLTYVMTGSEVQFFARVIHGLFPLAMILACWDLMLRRQDARYAAGGALGALLFARVLRSALLAGLAEDPVSSMGFLCFYCLLLGERASGWREAQKFLLFGAIAAAGAALTKQAGWHLAAVFPVLAWLLVIRAHAPGAASRAWALLACVAGVAALAGPWYVYRQLNPSDSEFNFIFGGVHAGRSYPERAAWGLHQLTMTLGVPPWALLTAGSALLALSLLDRSWRWITVLFTVPFVIAWSLLFSYDLRNLAMAVFPAGVAMAVGVGAALRTIERGNEACAPPRPIPWLPWAAAAGAVVAVAALSLGPLRDARLLDRQRRQQSEIYSPEVNHAVLAEAQGAGLRGKILSNYQILPYLPGLGDAYVPNPLNNAAFVGKALRDSGIRYVLYYGWPPHPEFLGAGIPPVRFTPIRTGTCPNGAAYMFLSVDRP